MSAKTARTESNGPKVLHPVVRCVLSVLFALHLVGVFIAPHAASVQTAYSLFPNREADFLPFTRQAPAETRRPPERPWLLKVYQPYLQIAYLDHGYNFFAPDPGPSFLIRYHLTMVDGTMQDGVMPNLADQWPRLRYHRHFMLTSMAQSLPRGSEQWYARHLLEESNAEHARLELVRHRLLSSEEVLAGKHLDDADTYQTIGTVDFHKGQEVSKSSPAAGQAPVDEEPEVIALPPEALQ